MTVTINPPMPSLRAESSPGNLRRERAVRWLLPAALLALAPKCMLCVLAYIGLGAALGLGGPEWCRAAGNGSAVSWVTALAWIGAAGVVGVMAAISRCRRGRDRG